MLNQLLQYNDLGLFVLRLVVGIVFLVHGLPKLKNAKSMSRGMGMPYSFVLGLGLVESASSLALIFGIYTQLASLLLAVVMVGAIYFKINKWKMSFTAHDKTGWEFDLTLLASNIVILLSGGGVISIL